MEASKKQNRLWGTLGVIAVFLATKLKFIIALLKFAKLQTLISMFLSLGFYAAVFGWQFGVALVYLLFVHEMGHLAAAKLKNVPTSPAIFIPFMGAVIGIDPKEIKDAKTESFIAYGGPFAGLLSVLPAIPLFYMTEEPLFALIVYLGAFLNLFNLLPVHPLDGGRIVASLSTYMWAFGLLILILLNFVIPGPMLLLITILGFLSLFSHLSRGQQMKQMEQEVTEAEKELRKISWQLDTLPLPETREDVYEFNRLLHKQDKLKAVCREHGKEIQRIRMYYKTDVQTKVTWGLLYLALIAVLAFIMVGSLTLLESLI